MNAVYGGVPWPDYAPLYHGGVQQKGKKGQTDQVDQVAKKLRGLYEGKNNFPAILRKRDQLDDPGTNTELLKLLTDKKRAETFINTAQGLITELNGDQEIEVEVQTIDGTNTGPIKQSRDAWKATLQNQLQTHREVLLDATQEVKKLPETKNGKKLKKTLQGGLEEIVPLATKGEEDVLSQQLKVAVGIAADDGPGAEAGQDPPPVVNVAADDEEVAEAEDQQVPADPPPKEDNKPAPDPDLMDDLDLVDDPDPIEVEDVPVNEELQQAQEEVDLIAQQLADTQGELDFMEGDEIADPAIVEETKQKIVQLQAKKQKAEQKVAQLQKGEVPVVPKIAMEKPAVLEAPISAAPSASQAAEQRKVAEVQAKVIAAVQSALRGAPAVTNLTPSETAIVDVARSLSGYLPPGTQVMFGDVYYTV